MSFIALEVQVTINKTIMLLIFQAEEAGLGENEGPGTERIKGDRAESQEGEGGEEAPTQQPGEEEASAEDPKTAADEAEKAAHDADKVSTDTDTKDPEIINGKNEGKMEEDKEKVEPEKTEKNIQEVEDECKDEENSKCEEKPTTEEKDADGVKEPCKDEEKGEKSTEEPKAIDTEPPNEAEENEQTREVDVGMKEKGQVKEGEKQVKPKRKSGPPSSCLSRPRPSARSIRASTKNDIIAKFQQGAPE